MVITNSPKRVLFVCLGNICRSPSAESIFRKKSEEKSLVLEYDSAGTLDYHVGDRSDTRSIKHAEKRGYEMIHRARQINQSDFEKFDLIFVMDQKNLKDVTHLCPPEHQTKIKMLTDYRVSMSLDIVPDPYYGGPQDFETVLDIIEDAWQGFLKTYFPSAKP